VASSEEDDQEGTENAARTANGSRAGASASGSGPHSAWMCRAEALVVTYPSTAAGEVGTDNRISLLGNGKTRDDAAYQAFSDCGAMETLQITRAQSAGGWSQTTASCHVTQCLALGQ